jgi:acyl-CoA synthetase (AMP-forming)/AMP-acid ligase II
MMNLIEILTKNSKAYPDASAVVEIKPLTRLKREVRWREFDERVNKLASSLQDIKINKGKKVLLIGRNSINWLEAYFAIMKTGAWVTPLNYRFTNDEILYCAKVAEPEAFIFDAEYAERIDVIRSKLPTVRKYISTGGSHFKEIENMEDLIGQADSAFFEVELKDEDECGLYFTSGTTGAPKPILLIHKNLFCAAITEATNHSWKHSDSLLMMPPMYHLAIGHLLGCYLVGGRTILLTEGIKPKTIFETVSEEKISVVFMLVPWALDVLEALDRGDLRKEDYNLGCWRLMHMGAQPIPASLIERWKKHFPDMQYDTTYGLSEGGGPGIIDLGVENETKIGAIGKPSLIWDARIVDERGEDVLQGQVGELIVKGNGVMKGYYKNPELTFQTIRNRWLHTGDLAKADEEGFIYIVDRKKDLVISGGENIFPVEIEEIIQKHPKVRDVAVIGTPDKRLGEVVTAVIEPKAGEVLTEEEMTSFCERHLARYKRPRRIIFEQVPRSPTGKLEKPKLREKFGKIKE